MSIFANAKSETEQALNIIIESATVGDRSFPGVGNGNVNDLKLTLVLLGYDVMDSSNSSGVSNNIDYDLVNGGATSRNANTSKTNVEKQVSGPVLLSTGGFIKNNEATWDALKAELKLNDFSNSTLISLFKKSSSKIQRVFYVGGLNETEKYISLLLPLLTKVN